MSSRLKTAFAFLCLSASFFSSYHILIPAALTSVLLSYKNMRELRNYKFYLMILIFASVPALFLPPAEAFGFAGSVVLRMVAVYGGFLTLSSNMNFSLLRERLSPFLGSDFSRSFALSLNLFPAMRSDLEAGWAVMHLNSCRRPRVANFPKMAVRCAVRNAGEISMRLKVREKMLPEVVIVKGNINSGKTGELKKIVEEEKSSGNNLIGFISPGVFENGDKTGFDAVDLKSGRRISLSRKNWSEEKGEKIGWCVLRRESLQWAEELFDDITPGSVLFIDEAGPLELGGGGFAGLIEKAARSEAARIYIASRTRSAARVADKFFQNHRVRYVNI